MGPHTFNFEEAASLAEEAGAALRQENLAQAVTAVLTLAADPAHQATLAQAANDFAQAHRGAADKTTAAVLVLLAQQGVDAL
jgi:3-deoxy-D-manno-octulosonic-acid transferase